MDVGPDPWGARPAAAAGGRASVPSVRPNYSQPSEVDEPQPLLFLGRRADFARITARGLLLYIPTFGFNRFWLRTEQRRYLWLNTTLGGDSFEYRGTPIELVIGFLFAIGIYMPLALGYSLAGLYAETFQTYASLPFFILTFAFGHFAAFRARRYRLTRTSFRGIRFWMHGSGWEMGFKALGYLILVMFTGGLAWPWMQAWLERYKMRRSHFGNVEGAFSGTGWGLLKSMFWPMVVLIVVGFFVSFSLVGSMGDPLTRAAGILVFLPILTFLFVYFCCTLSVITAVRLRWWINHVSFGEVRTRCALGAFSLVWPAFRTAVLVLVVIGVWVMAPLTLYGAKIAGLDAATNYAAAILATLWALLGLVLLMFLRSTFYTFDLTRKLMAAVTVEGAGNIAFVHNQFAQSGAVGEGLADALGVDGF